MTALHYAAYGGFDEAVEMLLAAGADPAAEDADGASPLQYALSQSGHARAADALLRSSASSVPSDVESELRIEDYFST